MRTPVTATFQNALDQHEIPDFFKGNGFYFAKGCDWGDHLHINNWQGMCAVLRHQDSAQVKLTRIFEEYVQSLEENYIDSDGLLSNLRAYYILRKKNPFLSAAGYDLTAALGKTSRNKAGVLFRLLRISYDKENAGTSKYSFAQELQRLRSLGCTLELESL